MGGGYFAVYQPKDGVEVFTGIVAVSAAIMQTPWQQPPLNMPVSYFMLRDPNDDPMRGEKELMDPGWFMREMSQYDGPGARGYRAGCRFRRAAPWDPRHLSRGVGVPPPRLAQHADIATKPDRRGRFARRGPPPPRHEPSRGVDGVKVDETSHHAGAALRKC